MSKSRSEEVIGAANKAFDTIVNLEKILSLVVWKALPIVKIIEEARDKSSLALQVISSALEQSVTLQIEGWRKVEEGLKLIDQSTLLAQGVTEDTVKELQKQMAVEAVLLDSRSGGGGKDD